MKRKCILCGLVLLQIFIAVSCQKTVSSYPSGGFQNLGTSEESNDPLNRRSGGEYCETSDIKLESNQGLVLTDKKTGETFWIEKDENCLFRNIFLDGENLWYLREDRSGKIDNYRLVHLDLQSGKYETVVSDLGDVYYDTEHQRLFYKGDYDAIGYCENAVFDPPKRLRERRGGLFTCSLDGKNEQRLFPSEAENLGIADFMVMGNRIVFRSEETLYVGVLGEGHALKITDRCQAFLAEEDGVCFYDYEDQVQFYNFSDRTTTVLASAELPLFRTAVLLPAGLAEKLPEKCGYALFSDEKRTLYLPSSDEIYFFLEKVYCRN